MKRTVHDISLPNDFAQKLLDNQIEFKLADSPSKQTISNLVELYTYGVEYYESIRSYKYMYFQKKMNELFTSGTALEIMNKPTSKEYIGPESPVQKKLQSKHEEEKIQALKIKEKQQKMFNEVLQKTNYTVTSTETKHILKDAEQKTANVEKVIKNQLENQSRSLEQKLKLRKSRSIIAKSMSSIELFEKNSETRDSLFEFDNQNAKAMVGGSGGKIMPQGKSIIKQPIVVNFQSLINENDQSDEEEEQVIKKRKKSVWSKRIMSTDDLHDVKDDQL